MRQRDEEIMRLSDGEKVRRRDGETKRAGGSKFSHCRFIFLSSRRIVASSLCLIVALTACQRSIFESPTVSPSTLKDVPAQRLNFRFEADVPPPTDPNQKPQAEERNAAIQNDFDTNRPLEILVKTIPSPDKKRVLVVYSKAQDAPSEFRLDMYTPDGKILRRVTPDGMGVHFPDTIVWSPDSANVAFVAMIRAGQTALQPSVNSNSGVNSNTQTDANTQTDSAENANSANQSGTISDAETNLAPVVTPPIAEAPTNVLTFRTEQIYLCNSEGDGLKPITQNEGLIYFYYVWSPDSSMLAALAAKFDEWRFLQFQADKVDEVFVPQGRPRIVEKNGRERRLDDNLTAVRPVWSPDSAKVAIGFDKQIRIYDGIGESPTQAAIPLRNQLLISSQKYDQELQRREQNVNAPAADAAAPTNQTVSTLPDENSLVSFNPIINLVWEQDSLLYLQTGFVKQFKNGEGSRSYLRWHRLVFSPQAVALGN